MSVLTAVYLLLVALFLHNLFPATDSSASTSQESNAQDVPLSPPVKAAPTPMPDGKQISFAASSFEPDSGAEPGLSPMLHSPNRDALLESKREPMPADDSGTDWLRAVPPAPTAVAQSFGELIIPKIGVHHRVTAVSIIDGSWDISQLEGQVGHLQSTGTHPQDHLAMTFIGHVTVPWPGQGAFADLILLKRGEEIVYRWGGNDYVYQVTRIFRVQPDDVHILYHDAPNTIQLATCSGWDLLDRSYSERLVTRAALVRVDPTPFK